MIKTENMTINGRELVRTFSDAGYMIERDGIRYEEAVDPAEFGRTYTETDETAYADEDATADDYQAALDEMGVQV